MRYSIIRCLRREKQLVLEGTAFDNFINAIRSKSSQKFYLVGLKKFMAYNRIQKVSDMLVWDQRLIEAKIISWIVNMRDKESYIYHYSVISFCSNDILQNERYRAKTP